jgi:UDP-N-acetyl-D-mannosaminuronic acid dehydrogenase
MKKVVSVLGAGYIGLPTAAILSSSGFAVSAVDTNKDVVDQLLLGNFNFTEPGLNEIVENAIQSKKLTSSRLPKKSDVFIIAVPTPFGEDRRADLSFVTSAINSITPLLESGNLVIVESTVPVGTTEIIADSIEAMRPDLSINGLNNSIFLAYCPERVLPGQILKELVENARIIGGINLASTEMAIDFYKNFVTGELLPTNSKTAELVKLAENTYRDVNISLANEFSLVCQDNSIDVWEMIRLANKHPRVNILNPGPGVGGHCIAVDPWFIIEKNPDRTKLIRTAREVNDSIPSHVVNEVLLSAKKFSYPVIACLGLTYKANVSDCRESPSLEIVRNLSTEANFKILVVDPNIKRIDELFDKNLKIQLRTLDEAVDEADVLVVLVGHREFMSVDKLKINAKVVIDKVGIWKH